MPQPAQLLTAAYQPPEGYGFAPICFRWQGADYEQQHEDRRPAYRWRDDHHRSNWEDSPWTLNRS